MNATDVLILGAGPAGLSLSLFLNDRNVDSRILEKSSSTGGLARSIRVGPYTFDHSGHLLHTQKPEVLDLVRKRLRVRLDRIDRRSVCWAGRTFIPFPYQQNLFYLNPETVRESLVGFFRRPRLRSPRNFFEWLRASYGDGVGRQFLYPYNTKLWNVPLNRMDIDWVPRFLPASGAREMLKSAFRRETDAWGYNAVFYYPSRGGIGTIGDRLARAVQSKTLLEARITRIDLRARRVTLENGETWRYERLVSTIPLPEFLRLAGLPASPFLRSTGVTVFNVGIRGAFPHPFHWCYVPGPSIPFYRFGVYSNISSRAAPPGHSSLYIECAAPPGRLGRFRFSDVARHLGRMSLIRSGQVDTVQRLDLSCAYPVPLLGLRRYRDRLVRFLDKKNVRLLGRFGAWRYVAISDVIVEAKEMAEKLWRS